VLSKQPLSSRMFFFRWLLYSNVVVSLAVVSLCIQSQIELGGSVRWESYFFFLFFATMVIYHAPRVAMFFLFKDQLGAEKYRWIKHNPIVFFVLVALSLLGLIASLFFIQVDVWLLLLPAMIITVFYSLPYIGYGKKGIGLREIPYLKIFIIAGVWSYLSVCLTQNNYPAQTGDLACLFAERFLFIFCITLPFDIRDRFADVQSGLKTIPLLIGAKKSIFLAKGVLFVFMLLVVIHYSLIGRFHVIVPLMLSACLVYWVLCLPVKEDVIYYDGYLDGCMLLQSLWVCLSAC
jgi:4-hydroxybenzoate polyprenyltransferase